VIQVASNITAPTQFIDANNERYAYRRFGKVSGYPLLLLQHFTGTLDNWDPALTDRLAIDRELILFDNAGVGRSSGTVPKTIAGMAQHACAFLKALKLDTCDVLGFSLGGMVAQQMVQDFPSVFRRVLLVGTAPRGGEDIMHLEKPSLSKYLNDPALTVSRVGAVHRRAIRRSQEHCATNARRQRYLRRDDSRSEFLLAERKSPQRGADDVS